MATQSLLTAHRWKVFAVLKAKPLDAGCLFWSVVARLAHGSTARSFNQDSLPDFFHTFMYASRYVVVSSTSPFTALVVVSVTQWFCTTDSKDCSEDPLLDNHQRAGLCYFGSGEWHAWWRGPSCRPVFHFRILLRSALSAAR